MIADEIVVIWIFRIAVAVAVGLKAPVIVEAVVRQIEVFHSIGFFAIALNETNPSVFRKATEKGLYKRAQWVSWNPPLEVSSKTWRLIA